MPGTSVHVSVVAHGIVRLRCGTPESITPVSVRRSRAQFDRLAALGDPPPPIALEAVSCLVSARGVLVTLPGDRCQGIFGLGLQLDRIQHAGRKRHLQVNADPHGDLGHSHAPVPFFLSTAGYGVLIDTARAATFHFGTHAQVRPDRQALRARVAAKSAAPPDDVAFYEQGCIDDRILVEVPVAHGIDIYLFAGPTTGEALRRYILWSGGGCLPPDWGLGNWYRCYTGADQQEVLRTMDMLATDGMPIDVLGLEPGWQDRFYPNSFTWSSERFPDPAALAGRIHDAGMRMNLWENAFVHPDSPLARSLGGRVGDEPSTDGLVPDFLDAGAYAAFRDHHQGLIAGGADGFKCDECDASDFGAPWSFPDHTRFLSGADGEQMHALLATHYMHAIDDAHTLAGRPYFGQVRSGGVANASLPFAIYSDLYDHRTFIRGMASACASGLLWMPEVRHARSPADLIRRVQTAVFSPLCQINAWYIRQPPWRQVDQKRNNAGERMPGWEDARDQVRACLRLRRRLIPLLRTAFAAYQIEGTHPFRALGLVHPDDPATWRIDDQWYVGDDLIVAPLTAEQSERSVYLPLGVWHDAWTGQPVAGGSRFTISPPLDRIPCWVRAGRIVPLADPDDATRLVPLVAGDGSAGGRVWQHDAFIDLRTASHTASTCVITL